MLRDRFPTVGDLFDQRRPKISDRGVAEHPTSGQMLHPNRKLRLAPLYVRQSPGLKPSPRGLETLYLREKLCPCISTKSDKRRSDVNHACAFRMGEQSPECRLAIAVSTDHHKGRR